MEGAGRVTAAVNMCWCIAKTLIQCQGQTPLLTGETRNEIYTNSLGKAVDAHAHAHRISNQSERCVCCRSTRLWFVVVESIAA